MRQFEKFLPHDCIAKKQDHHYSKMKRTCISGLLLAVLDFVENCAFVGQEAAQAFHWNNKQATIFLDNDNDYLQSTSVGVSDCLEQDSVSVYMFQSALIVCSKRN